ncbi:MAG TPA: flagellar biosynthesis anti-sigma factor FlgM [Bryobacteraceae bacterium]|nr:flagellar biosynthesis anti-sigma factor FlgM [Bryobacteraceae bacterium]
MKIENSALQLTGLNSTQQIEKATSEAVEAHRNRQVQDQVNLSSFAQAYASDSAKVSQLKSAYEAGTYRISPDKVAGGMINDALAA